MADPLTHYENGNHTVEEIFNGWGARDMLMGALDTLCIIGWRHAGWQKSVNNLTTLLLYADWFTRSGGRTGKKAKRMDVPRLVSMWVESVVAMTTGHDHAVFTAAEHSSDDLLSPLLTCPIAQLREFASGLATALEADTRVPFLVWSSMRTVVEPLVMSRPEGAILSLKKGLALQIAQKVESGLDRKDIVLAIAGALSWRDTETLKKVEQAVDAGEKPKIRGRQSCLFLMAGDAQVIL